MSWGLVFLFLNLFELKNYWIIVNFFLPTLPSWWHRLGKNKVSRRCAHACGPSASPAQLWQSFQFLRPTKGIRPCPSISYHRVYRGAWTAPCDDPGSASALCSSRALSHTPSTRIYDVCKNMKIILMISSTNSFQSVRWRKYTWLVHDARLQYGPESQGYTRSLVKYVFETKTFKWCEFTAVMVHPGSGQWCRTVFSWTLFRWLVSVFWPFNRIPQMWQGTVGASCKLSTCFFML